MIATVALTGLAVFCLFWALGVGLASDHRTSDLFLFWAYAFGVLAILASVTAFVLAWMGWLKDNVPFPWFIIFLSGGGFFAVLALPYFLLFAPRS